MGRRYGVKRYNLFQELKKAYPDLPIEDIGSINLIADIFGYIEVPELGLIIKDRRIVTKGTDHGRT